MVQAALVDDRHRNRLVATVRDDIDTLVGMLDRSPGVTASTTASRALATTLLTSLVTMALLHPEPTDDDSRMLTTTVDLLLAGAAKGPPEQPDRARADLTAPAP